MKLISHSKFIYTVGIAAIIALCVSFASARAAEKEVNLYSGQKEHLIRPLLDKFKEQTGIHVNLVTGKQPALMAKLKAEGEHTPADVLMMADVGNLVKAQQSGLLQMFDSELLKEYIPAQWRDVNDHWFGFALRARAIYVRKDEEAPRTYEDITDKEWNNGVLVMSSDNIYNQSMLASRIHYNGEQKSLEWAKGVVANFARSPEGNERDQLRALAAGEGKVAIANSYYFGKLLHSEDKRDRELAGNLSITFPNQETTGTHVNIRGAAIVKHAKNKEEAKQLLEFLISEPAQKYFTNKNYEYPVRKGVDAHETVVGWGAFKQDALSLEAVGNLNRKAVEIFDRAGWQ